MGGIDWDRRRSVFQDVWERELVVWETGVLLTGMDGLEMKVGMGIGIKYGYGYGYGYGVVIAPRGGSRRLLQILTDGVVEWRYGIEAGWRMEE